MSLERTRRERSMRHGGSTLACVNFMRLDGVTMTDKHAREPQANKHTFYHRRTNTRLPDEQTHVLYITHTISWALVTAFAPPRRSPDADRLMYPLLPARYRPLFQGSGYPLSPLRRHMARERQPWNARVEAGDLSMSAITSTVMLLLSSICRSSPTGTTLSGRPRHGRQITAEGGLFVRTILRVARVAGWVKGGHGLWIELARNGRAGHGGPGIDLTPDEQSLK